MPIGISTAIAGAAVVGAGATIASSSKASSTAQKTADQNNALQQQIYGENKAALAPYEAAGTPATSSINALLGLSNDNGASAKAYSQWQNSTGYQAALKQGQNSVTAALGAKGLTDSGAALKALTQYGQDSANQNFQTYLGDLSNQQGVGLTAASAQAGVGQGYANSVSANNNNAANASENAALTGGNAINGALGNALSSYAYTQGLGSSYGGSSSFPDPYGVQTSGAGGGIY